MINITCRQRQITSEPYARPSLPFYVTNSRYVMWLDAPVAGVTWQWTSRCQLCGFCSHQGRECWLAGTRRTSVRRGWWGCCDVVGCSAVTQADLEVATSNCTQTCQCRTALTVCGSAGDRCLPVGCHAAPGRAGDEDDVTRAALCGRCDCWWGTCNAVRTGRGKWIRWA